MSIRRLSPFMVNQIAAGEVVERPASVVKELVENAIDAEASRIRIEIDKGGHERIEVIDDGNGIVQEELPLALESHATSKITDPCDLDGVATMGFRGEALASITSVARVVVRSRTRDAAEASVIEGEGERREGPKPAAGPVGTSVAVHQLFGRVPARRKFLKSEAAEMRRITRIVHRLTMSHPDIAFTLISNGRTTLELKARKDVRRRILDVMGPELDEHMLDLDVTREGIRLWGLVGLPEVARPTSQHQQFYLNGRPISDRSVSHALREAYRGLIEPSRHPTAVLFLQVEPTRVDVNVHPAKTEVRFRDERLIHSIVRRGVLECLGRSDLTPDLSVAESSPPASTRPLFGSGGRSGGGVRLTPPPVTSVGGGVGKGFDAEAARELARDLSERPAVIPSPVPSSPVLQVHKTFLVTEDEHGMVIIDQHALHERVMFERLLARIESGPLPSQRLLVPEVIDADPIHLEGLEQISPLMERLGLEATPSGPRTIALHAVPVLLFERGVKAGSFLKDLLERAGEGTLSTTDEEEALREVLDMMACKAAVKAGDQLSSRELADLLEMRETVERSSNCPHGRPTSLRLSMEDLERQFGRR